MNVYITKSGNKYHTNRYCIRNYKYDSISEEEAKKMGKTLCKTCESGKFFYNKKKNYKNINIIENLINDNDPDNIIYNNSNIKNKENLKEDNKLEQNSNTLNNINKIVNQKINLNFFDQSQNSINFNEYKKEINIHNKEIRNGNNSEIDDKKDNNNNNPKNKQKISQKIESDIEKDKIRGNNFINKIETNNKNIIKNEIKNKIEDTKDEVSNSSSLSLTNFMKSKQASICGIGDMNILAETYNEAITISLPLKNSSNNNETNLFKNYPLGKYKYNFKIKNLKKDSYAEIEVGFKIIYKNSSDINFMDKDLYKYKNKNFEVGTKYDKIIISKKIILGKSSDTIYVLINVNEGKFFIIGKDELEKRKRDIFLDRNNSKILYIKSIGPLYYMEVKIEPIFIFDENTSRNCQIKFNGKIIN